jgi:hypothetical protein
VTGEQLESVVRSLNQLSEQQLKKISSTFQDELQKEFLAAVAGQDRKEALKALLNKYEGLADHIVSRIKELRN